jgi:cytochrome c oxidase subunit II
LIIDSLVVSASSYAEDIDFVWELIFVMTAFWSVLCFCVFFWFLFKYRRKEGVKAEYITGEEDHQKRLISIPHALVLLCDVFVIYFAVTVWYDVKQDLPENPDAEIRIMAQQWAWTFVHPGPDGKLDTKDDITTTDELHVEVDKTYVFRLESRDVMHDFSVPIFRLKQDAIPGRVISGWFKPTKANPVKDGKVQPYDIQCAEMCGIGHGIMGARIYVETSAQHTAWMNTKRTTELATNTAL